MIIGHVNESATTVGIGRRRKRVTSCDHTH